MLIRNKYYKWYQRICDGWPCTKDCADDYTERHHILPRCMGGLNGKDNIAVLSYRKHFIAHWLLTKCTQRDNRQKLLAAMGYMTAKKRFRKEGRIVSGWQFAIAKNALRAMNTDLEFITKRNTALMTKLINPEYQIQNVVRSRSWWNDPGHKDEQANRMRARMSNPDVKAAHVTKMITLNADPVFATKRNTWLAAARANPIFQAKRIAGLKIKNSDPKFQENRISKVMAKNSDPEFTAKRILSIKTKWADPKFKAEQSVRTRSRNLDPIFRAATIARLKIQNADPIFQAKAKAGQAIARASRKAAIFCPEKEWQKPQ